MLKISPKIIFTLFTTLYAREICEVFVYKHLERNEYVKNSPTFYEIYKFHG